MFLCLAPSIVYSHSKIGQMTMCNVKGIACSQEPIEISPDTAGPLSFAERFSIFYLIGLVLWSTTLLFWFSFTSLTDVISTRQLFSATCLAPNNKDKLLTSSETELPHSLPYTLGLDIGLPHIETLDSPLPLLVR